MTPLKETILDGREMECPEPLRHSIEVLKTLDEDTVYHMIQRKEPIPLIEMAKGWGFSVLSKQTEDEAWHVLITKNNTVDLGGLLDV